jgi:chorismate dehydratase
LPKLRVGIVNFLNSRPLAWGFLKGHHSDLFTASYHPPSTVARLLAEGGLDVGLIPSVEVQRIPGLSVLPDLCIGATAEVRSVLLVADRPLAEVRRVALDVNSRTSVALLKVLCAERWGIAPQWIDHRPEVERMLAVADAALVIGDPALKVDRERYRVIDLAAEWRALTGLPFVFAVWAVRPEVDLPDLAFYFKSSLRFGLSSLDAIVREAAAEMDLDSDLVHTYLTRNLRFFLQEPEIEGLTTYWRLAEKHGLIAEARPLVLQPA